MPSIIKKVMKQRAVYWPPIDGPNQFNEKSYQRAVVVKCRWEEKSEEILSAVGERVISNAKIMVDRDMVVGGFLLLLLGGMKPPKTVTDEQLLASIPNQLDPKAQANDGHAFEILRFEKTPTLKVTDFLRIAFL